MSTFRHEGPGDEAIRRRAFELSGDPDSQGPLSDWLRAERELSVVQEYDTRDRDLERVGLRIVRVPLEAGVLWRLTLPTGRVVEEWEPGTAGLSLPAEITRIVAGVVAGKPLQPGPPRSADSGALRLRELIEVQRRSLLSHDPGIRAGVDADDVRRFRVAARRMRAFLRAASPYVDPVWRRALDAPLRDLGAVSNPVRDLDVLHSAVLRQLDSLDALDAPGGRALVGVLQRQRDDARHALLALLAGDAYAQLLERMRLPPRLAVGIDVIPLERVARREVQRLAKAVRRLGADPDTEAVHRLRIRLKRARYAAELLGPSGKAGRRFVRDAKTMQDLLGAYNDAAVAEERLRAATVESAATAAAFVAGRIAERQAARRSELIVGLPAAWQRLRRSAKRL